MYKLIERHSELVVSQVGSKHVENYSWLTTNLGSLNTPEYKERYRNFWALNAARLGEGYLTEYFKHLDSATRSGASMEQVVRALHEVPCNGSGRKSLQFSFASKLLHMADPHRPIYDGQVAAFYFFSPPPPYKGFESRLSRLLEFYSFLEGEYARVLHEGLLDSSISCFRSTYDSSAMSDVKVIDTLIWGFVSLLWMGQVMTGGVHYE